MFQTKFVGKIKEQISYSVTFYGIKNHAVYEIIWKNIVERERQQVTM